MELLTPWYSPSDARRTEAELARELHAAHVLSGIPVKAIALRQDRDDAAFELQDGSSRVAVVHLTRSRESDAQWPATTIYSNRAEFSKRVAEDHAEFET